MTKIYISLLILLAVGCYPKHTLPEAIIITVDCGASLSESDITIDGGIIGRLSNIRLNPNNDILANYYIEKDLKESNLYYISLNYTDLLGGYTFELDSTDHDPNSKTAIFYLRCKSYIINLNEVYGFENRNDSSNADGVSN